MRGDERIPKAIIDKAYEDYDAGDQGIGIRLVILADVQHQEIHRLPKLVAEAVVAALDERNGIGRRRMRDRARAYALPVIGGGGVGTLLLIKAVELLRLL